MQGLFIFFFILLLQHCHAQTNAMNKGYLIYNLGVDTTMIGYYQLHENDFQFKVMGRPNLSVTQIKGSLYPNGELKEARGYSYSPTLTGEGKRLVDYYIYVDHDTTYIQHIRDGKETLQKYPGRAMVANAIGTPFLFLLPVLTSYAPKSVGTTVEGSHFVLSQNRKFTIKRLSPELLEMGSNIMGYFKLHLDKNGKLKYIDGMGSSWNVKGTVFDELDMDDYIKRFISKEQQAPLKPLNKKDSIVVNIDGVDIRIDYWRPSARGRVIFGEVVPWDRIWRAGANEPTTLTINKPLYFDGKELPAGQYSVFILPAKERWTFIINKQTKMWGTDHNASYDFMRVPMKTITLDKPVELMTIEVSRDEEQPGVSIIWERTKAFVPFKTK
jgi:hypothetical protein